MQVVSHDGASVRRALGSLTPVADAWADLSPDRQRAILALADGRLSDTLLAGVLAMIESKSK